MQKRAKHLLRAFTLGGIAFGLTFPVAATLLACLHRDMDIQLNTILTLHGSEPLMWLIDLAPLVLGIAGFLLGLQQEKIKLAAEKDAEDFEQLFQVSADILCVANMKSIFLKVNPAFTTLLGYSESEMVGALSERFVHPDDLNATRNARFEIQNGKKIILFENRYVTKDNRIVYISWKGTPTLDGRVFAVGRDVTRERENARNRLQEDQERKAILQYANFSIISTDPEGIIRTFNSTAETLLGYKSEELVGKYSPAVIHVKEEIELRSRTLSKELGKNIPPGFETFVIKSREQNLADENDWTYVRKDGTVFPVRLSVTTLRDENGNVTGYLGIGKDITEIRAIEDRLRESERMMREFLESLPVGIFIMTSGGSAFFANRKSGEMLGKGILPQAAKDNLSEIYTTYKGDTDIIYPAAELPIVKALGGASSYADDLVLDQNGKKVPIEVWATPVTDEKGNIQFAIAAFNDISERREREQQVRLLSSVVSKTDNGVIISNGQGEVEWVNEGFTRITGYLPDEVKGKIPGRLLHGPRTSTATVTEIAEALRQKKTIHTEILNYNKQGRPFWVSLNITPLFNEDASKLINYFAILLDITARKKYELKIQMMLDIAASLYTLTDLHSVLNNTLKAVTGNTEWEHGEFWLLNETTGFAEYSGTSIATSPEAQKFLTSTEQLHIKKGQGTIGRVWESGNIEWIEDISQISATKLLRKDKAIEHGMRSSLVFPILQNGKPVMVCVLFSSNKIEYDEEMIQVFENVSLQISMVVQRISAESEREAYARSLEKSNKELDQFAYIVSHDLKAPLRAMYLLSQWAAEEIENANPSEARNHLATLQMRARRMESLIEAILKYSKVGRQNLQSETFDTDELISTALDSNAPPPKFTLSLHKGAGMITGKKTLLFQVFSNLISNAVKYHDKAAGTIEIGYRDLGSMIEFFVRDDGRGIDPVHHNRIFGVFQRLDPGGTVEGTGIGLSLVKKIVEGEGGTIRVESEAGQGATFFFTWPKNA